MINRREIAKTVESRFGTNPHIDDTYCTGSRSVRDMLETIVRADLEGNTRDGVFWRDELATLLPQFTETV